LVKALPPLNDLIEAGSVDLNEFKRFLDHLPVPVIISKMVKAEPRIMYANGAFETLTNRPLEEIRGKDWSVLDLFRHEDDPAVGLAQALLSNDDSVGTFQAENPRHVLVEAYSGVIQDENSQEKYRIAALVDVTKRARAQREEFARQIRDKDLLLKEIQHRVKNNLQLITALIRLEARSEHSADKAALDRLAGRIEALQLLYQTLSPDPSGHEVDLGQYLSQIAAGVMRAHAVDGIRLDVKVEAAPVSINVAMPVGLAVNELLTNAFKYAFRGRDSGIIALELLREESDRYRVVVADDGNGLPKGVSWPGDGKLGALIMQTMCENTKTDFEVESAPDRGTRVAISFV
jgi:two-component sensor histidine kinase